MKDKQKLSELCNKESLSLEGIRKRLIVAGRSALQVHLFIGFACVFSVFTL